MELVINFLEDNNYDWSINLRKYESPEQIMEKFGYISKSNNQYSASKLKDYLKEEIKNKLNGSALSNADFKKISDHFAFKYYSSESKNYENQFILLQKIKFIINRLESYTTSLADWIEVKNLVEAYLSVSNYSFDVFDSIQDERKVISESIKFLRNKGYFLTIKNGDIIINEADKNKIFLAIDYRFKKIGHRYIDLIIGVLYKYYDENMQRYFLRPEPTMTEAYEADIPFGYLFNVALANLHEGELNHKKFQKKTVKLAGESIELAKHYFCINRLQSFNKFSDINHNRDTILHAIQKNILYDQFFSIDQISVVHIQEMIRGIFLSPALLSINIDFSIYANILNFVSFKSNANKLFVFDSNEIIAGLSNKYTKDQVLNALNRLSFKSNEINKGYLIPENIEKRNYFERPFVCVGDKYIYINPNLCNYGFYYSLTNLCEEKGVKGDKIGKLAEDFVKNKFQSCGVIIHANKTYKVSKEIANELNITSRKGECDFVVETKNTIIFIELKRKTLTVEARKGNVLQSAVDLAQSFLHALAQTGRHEYIIRKNNALVFTDGTKLDLLGRDVERISLSLFDFYSMHDGAFIHQIVSNLMYSNISSGNKEEDDKINKILNELSDQFRTDIFSEAYKSNIFFNCRFFSVPQLLEVLSHVSNNEEFLTELNRTRQASTGCKDWFKDYSFIRRLQSS